MDSVKSFREGGETAFLALFDDHHLPLFRFAYRLTGSVADAEDIVQECFLELLRPTCSYVPERGPLRTYLFGVVRNQSLNRVRKTVPAGEETLGASTYSPEGDAMRMEMRNAVSSAIMQLPEIQREALILAHYEQMPLAEIAAVLNIEIGAVKSRLQRARAGLKELLAVYAPAMERNK